MKEKKPELIRAVGLFDLTLLLIAAVVNLNMVPVVAGGGYSVISYWLLAFLFFFLPVGIAVIELSSRYPEEGGIYVWTKAAFGDIHAFLSGWCYWTNNVVYIPTLLFYLAGFFAFATGQKEAGFADNPSFMMIFSIAALWLIIALNIYGVSIGKWIQNIGGMGTFVTAALLVGIGADMLFSNGIANPIRLSAFLPKLSNFSSLSLFSTVCFAFVGLELGSVMGDEIVEPRRTIPKGVALAGIACALLYVLCTFAVQAAIPVKEIGVIQGILQAVSRVAGNLNLQFLVSPIAILLSLSIAGTTCVWLAGSARIPFVMGIENYMPAVIGKVHPRYRTPYVAMIVQGIASTIFILMNVLGSSVKEAYLVLLDTGIVVQLIPFLYLFAAAMKILLKKSLFEARTGFFQSSRVCVTASAIGFLTTMFGLAFAFVPSPSIRNVFLFEIKMVIGTTALILPAAIILLRRARKAPNFSQIKIEEDFYEDRNVGANQRQNVH